MEDWKQLDIKDVTFIEKCVAEFNVGELVKTPYSKFKVKIFEKQDGTFIGFTNLQLRNQDGSPFPGVGYGATIEKALADTISYFFGMIDEKENISDEDFECADPYDF